MNRSQRIHQLADIRYLMMLIVLVLYIYYQVQLGIWALTLPALILTFIVTYLLRGILIAHVSIVRKVMSYSLVVTILAVLLLRDRVSPDTLWVNLLVSVFVGVYLGAFFLLVVRERQASLPPPGDA